MASETMLSDITLETLIDHCLDGMFVLDGNRRFVLFTKGCERITGYDRGSIVGAQCKCHDLTECRDRQERSLAGALCPSRKIFDGDLSSARQRMQIRHRDGHRVWVETVYTAVHNENGDITHVVGIMRDMTEARETEDGFREAAARIACPDRAPDRAHGVETSASRAGHDGDKRSLDQVLNSLERQEVIAALHRAKGQRTLAAELLHISRSRLYRRMEALGIDPRAIGFGETD